MRRILITGMSGTGKSSALVELRRRGYDTVDTDDDGWCEWSVASATPDWIWHAHRMSELLARPLERSLFISGCASNQGRFYDRFDEVVLMSAPAEVILNRVAARSTNQYGKRSEERAEILANLAEVEPLLRATATLEIDASVPLAEVVDRLADLADR